MPQATAKVTEAEISAIDRLVLDGHFMNRSDAVRSAVRLLIHTFDEVKKAKVG